MLVFVHVWLCLYATGCEGPHGRRHRSDVLSVNVFVFFVLSFFSQKICQLFEFISFLFCACLGCACFGAHGWGPKKNKHAGKSCPKHPCPTRCYSTRNQPLIRQARTEARKRFTNALKKVQAPLHLKILKHLQPTPDPPSPKRGWRAPTPGKRS